MKQRKPRPKNFMVPITNEKTTNEPASVQKQPSPFLKAILSGEMHLSSHHYPSELSDRLAALRYIKESSLLRKVATR